MIQSLKKRITFVLGRVNWIPRISDVMSYVVIYNIYLKKMVNKKLYLKNFQPKFSILDFTSQPKALVHPWLPQGKKTIGTPSFHGTIWLILWCSNRPTADL